MYQGVVYDIKGKTIALAKRSKLRQAREILDTTHRLERRSRHGIL